ncbi:MAG: hypothetical protein HY335_03945, partial [Deinococcus sp.]|nr:hypothetical protein [Deinococcus sp.]
MKPVESAALALSSVLPLRAARCLLERALRHAGLDPATAPAEQVGAVLRGPVFEAVRQVVPVTETRLWEVATRMVPPELLPTVHQQPARQAEPAAAAPAPAPTMAPPPPGEPEAPIPDELWHRFLPFSRRPTPQVAEFSELARAL